MSNIHVDAWDFSECRSEEVISFFRHSGYILYKNYIEDPEKKIENLQGVA